jgi:hypothetical protein
MIFFTGIPTDSARLVAFDVEAARSIVDMRDPEAFARRV